MPLNYIAFVSHTDEAEVVPVYKGLYRTACAAKQACEQNAQDNGEIIEWEEPYRHTNLEGFFQDGEAIDLEDKDEAGNQRPSQVKYLIRPVRAVLVSTGN